MRRKRPSWRSQSRLRRPRRPAARRRCRAGRRGRTHSGRAPDQAERLARALRPSAGRTRQLRPPYRIVGCAHRRRERTCSPWPAARLHRFQCVRAARGCRRPERAPCRRRQGTRRRAPARAPCRRPWWLSRPDQGSGGVRRARARGGSARLFRSWSHVTRHAPRAAAAAGRRLRRSPRRPCHPAERHILRKWGGPVGRAP